jgi:hypothetical protein
VDPGGTHVENVFFQSHPASGIYRVWVVNYDGRLAGDVSVEVSGQAEHSWGEYLELGAGSTTTTWTFSI